MQTDELQHLTLFAPAASGEFGRQVAASLGIALSTLEEREFEDGEHKARPLGSVRGRDVFVIHSLYGEPGNSANDKLCRLLFLAGALKDAAAARVTAVVPYLAYARKDQKSQPRDPVTTRYVAAMFEAVGVDAVVTMDVHNLAAFQNAFRCRTEHLTANMLFVRHLAPLLQGSEVAVVSPDAGGMKRAGRFRSALSEVLGRPVGAGFAEKYRSQGLVSGDLLVGEVNGKQVIVIDDLISSGNTLARTARACRDRGATRVVTLATHGLFAAEAEKLLAEPAVDRIVITDTIPLMRLPAGPVKDKTALVSTAGLFAEAIRRMHTGGSLTELLSS